MTDKQLKFLTNFKTDKIALIGKTSDPEIQELVSDLKSLNVISEKSNNTTLIIKDLISFEKLIELKSLSDFKKWYSDKDKFIVDNSLNIHGNNYGIQSSNFSNNPQTNNITANNKADLKTNPIIKFWKLISENKLISSIIFVIILYLIKVIFGIDLKNI